uniref:Secreted protein n=1 Tax=Mesocestoides corti TaxID=53468 RepID=A0A5K3ERQ3_MESCO
MLFSYLRAIETVSRGSLAGAIKSDGATPEANQLQDHVIPPLSIITCYFAPKCSLPLCMNTTVGVWICAEQKADTAVPCRLLNIAKWLIALTIDESRYRGGQYNNS